MTFSAHTGWAQLADTADDARIRRELTQRDPQVEAAMREIRRLIAHQHTAGRFDGHGHLSGEVDWWEN